jgi:pimeloyl-ACP methyl ester carboxylesterase
MSAKFSHHFADVNGIFIHYVKQGNGPRLVVLLHGFPEFWYSWRYVIPALSEQYTVVAPDMRGFNDSDKPDGVEAYKTEYVIKDIKGLVEYLGFEKAVIVGHDWGGAVAWHFATAYPEMTEKLAILNCPHPKLMLKAATSDVKQILKSWYIFFFQLPQFPEFLVERFLPDFFKKAMKEHMVNPQNLSDDDLMQYVQAFRQKGSLTATMNYYRASLQLGLSKDLVYRKVKCPVRVIWGKEDQALNASMNDDLHTVVDGPFEVKYLSPCSHWTQIDRPDDVNRLLLEFIG